MPSSTVHVTALTCEYEFNPLGMDVERPRLGWQLESTERDVRQTAFQVLVSSNLAALDHDQGDVWDSGQVSSSDSIHQEYQGPSLQSRQRCFWKVRVWDGRGKASPWSDPAHWEMGLLKSSDWQAGFITPAGSVATPCPRLRVAFEVAGPVQAARIYVTSLGLYSLELNGQPVSDWLFTPGWTSYNKRLQYQTFDITAVLHPGPNAIGAQLAEGWYGGRVRGAGQPPGYGGPVALLAQIEITYFDGRVQVFGTDAAWKSAAGPIQKSDIYDGEDYDARLEQPGWSSAEHDDRNWSGVRLVEHDLGLLVAQAGPPVRRIETLRPVATLPSPHGQLLVDMGQNMVGWVRLRVRGPAGTTVTVRHAEVLDRAGRFYTENIRGAQQTDRYTLKGGGDEIFEPHFTFHGFRYVALEGYPGPLSIEDITAIVVHSDLPVTGRFECSNSLINQLQHNIVWGQKGNFLDVPTDCPQRDERLGWTGDAQVFLRTAAFNMNVAGFMTRWLKDLAADQYSDGAVPHTVPDVGRGAGATGWADAAVICPWTLYQLYGDERILAEQYDSMRAWIAYMRALAGDDLIWDSGFHFGDWLAVEAPDPQYPNPVTDLALISTAFFAYSTGIVAQSARVLDRSADAAEYTQLLVAIRAAFCREFLAASGRLASNTQTGYVLALQFDLLPPDQRAEAARRLAADVRRRGNHLSTGFLGTPYLCHVLSDHGYLDLAYSLLEQESYPSWLYPLTRGATTSWERWDNIKPDGSFQTPNANSFNHYAFGAIGDWLYRVVAGLNPDHDLPGYKRIVFRPRPGGSLSSASASLETQYGRVESRWVLGPGAMDLSVAVPANTDASVYLPGRSQDGITEGGQPLSEATGVLEIHQGEREFVLRIGSGRYHFRAKTV